MGNVWSDRAISQQVDINRTVRAFERENEALPSRQNPEMSTVVKALDTLHPNGKGLCEFLEGTMDGCRTGTGEREEMFNLASEVTINPGDECIAFQVHMPGLGFKGWSVQRIKASSNSGNQFECPVCTEEVLPQLQITISGLADAAALPVFDDWAGTMNGTWDLIHEDSGENYACRPYRTWTVPENNNKGHTIWPEGPKTVGVWVQFGPNFGGLIIMFWYVFFGNTSPTPSPPPGASYWALEMLKSTAWTTDAFFRVECGESATWTLFGGASGTVGFPSFWETWLTAGTFVTVKKA